MEDSERRWASERIRLARTSGWPENKLKAGAQMTKETLAALDAARHVSEVAEFLKKLKDSGYRVNALAWHYFKYKYEYGDNLPSINTLNERFDRVLNDPSAKVLKCGERLKVFSEIENRLAIIDGEGRRVSVYHPDETITPDWEDAIWQIKDLND